MWLEFKGNDMVGMKDEVEKKSKNQFMGNRCILLESEY